MQNTILQDISKMEQILTSSDKLTFEILGCIRIFTILSKSWEILLMIKWQDLLIFINCWLLGHEIVWEILKFEYNLNTVLINVILWLSFLTFIALDSFSVKQIGKYCC